MKYRHEERAAQLVEKLYRQEEGIMRAEKAVNRVDRDYEKFARKMAEMKNSMDRAQRVYDLKKEAREEGLAEGRAEGNVQGHAQGHAEGHAQGRAEGIEETTLEIARKMKATGIPAGQIHAITNLSTEIIETL